MITAVGNQRQIRTLRKRVATRLRTPRTPPSVWERQPVSGFGVAPASAGIHIVDVGDKELCMARFALYNSPSRPC
jgi:hypothetical protein